jgi:hypothetical protein
MRRHLHTFASSTRNISSCYASTRPESDGEEVQKNLELPETNLCFVPYALYAQSFHVVYGFLCLELDM